VVDDWWQDGRIDGTYADHCYDDAIESLPRDVRDYSSAQEDITRALQAKLRGEASPPAQADPTPEEGDGGTATPQPQPPPPPPPPPPGSTPNGNDPPEGPDASPPVGESASSVPVPLLILAGLALLLVIGGSAGYLIRRFQSRQIPPPAA
jgi:hypothetical protein